MSNPEQALETLQTVSEEIINNLFKQLDKLIVENLELQRREKTIAFYARRDGYDECRADYDRLIGAWKDLLLKHNISPKITKDEDENNGI